MPSEYIIPILMLAAGVVGWFIARELGKSDRLADRQGKNALTLARLWERMEAWEKNSPLLLQRTAEDRTEHMVVQGQQALAFDQNKLRDEIARIRGDMGTLEADVRGQITTAMGEMRATVASINDRIASMAARQSDYDQAQRGLGDKVNDIAVAIARIEARLETRPDARSPAADFGGLGAGEINFVKALRAAVIQGAAS